MSDEYKRAVFLENLNKASYVSTIITKLLSNSTPSAGLSDVNDSDTLRPVRVVDTLILLDSSNGTSNYTNLGNTTIEYQPTASYAELLFTTKSGIGWVGAAAMPTGWALWAVLGVIEIFSLPCIRKKGYFQVLFEFIFKINLLIFEIM